MNDPEGLQDSQSITTPPRPLGSEELPALEICTLASNFRRNLANQDKIRWLGQDIFDFKFDRNSFSAAFELEAISKIVCI